jgi:hypothetical protein
VRIRGARVLRVQADGVRQISLLSFSRIHRVTIFFERTFRFRIVAIFPSAWALRALRWLCRVTQFLECIARGIFLWGRIGLKRSMLGSTGYVSRFQPP